MLLEFNHNTTCPTPTKSKHCTRDYIVERRIGWGAADGKKSEGARRAHAFPAHTAAFYPPCRSGKPEVTHNQGEQLSFLAFESEKIGQSI